MYGGGGGGGAMDTIKHTIEKLLKRAFIKMKLIGCSIFFKNKKQNHGGILPYLDSEQLPILVPPI